MNRFGRVKFTTLLILLLLAGGVYAGVEIGGVYWRRMQLEEAVRQQIGFAGQLTDEAIHERILNDIAGMNLPPEARRVRLSRTQGPRALHVTISYSETANFLFTKMEMPVKLEIRRSF